MSSYYSSGTARLATAVGMSSSSSPSPRALGSVGFVASCVIVVAGSMRGWPFPNLTAEPWFYQLTSSSGLVENAFVVLFYVGVIALCWSWVAASRYARLGVLDTRNVIWMAVWWSAPLIVSVPLFSGDVYVYYVDGQALARGFSPYDSGVAAMGPDPLVHMVHPIWRDTQTMYGPLFMRMAQAVASVADDSVVTGVLLFRMVAVTSVALMGWGVWSLCKRFGRSGAEGLAWALLNPLTLLHLIGGAHNDATMLGLLLAGLGLGVGATNNRLRLLALALCVAGAAFKVPAFAGVLVLGWIWAGQNATFVRRSTSAALCGLVGVVLLHLCGWATQLGWGWTHASDVPGMAHPILAPANALAFASGGPFGVSYGVNSVTRAVSLLLSVSLCIWLVFRAGRAASAAVVIGALGGALVVLSWLGPAVYPWYVVWGVVVIGAVGPGALHKHLVVMTIAVSVAVAPGGYGWLDTWNDWRRTVVATLWCLVVALFVWTVVRSTRRAASSLAGGGSARLGGPAVTSVITHEAIDLTPPSAKV